MRYWRIFAAASLVAAPATMTAQSQLPTLPGVTLPDIGCEPLGGTFGSEALAGPFALAIATAGGITSCIDLSPFIVQNGKLFQILGASVNLGGLGTALVTATFNPDPYITFGATTTNIVAGPVTYGFVFGTPIVPGFYSGASSTAGLSLTAAPGGTATVTSPGLYPTYVSGFGTNGGTGTNLNVDLGTAPCTATSGVVPVTSTCNYGTASSTFAPQFFDNLEAVLTYNQSQVGSVASWSGAVTLTSAVPEPATIALVGSGVLLVGFVARRRRA